MNGVLSYAAFQLLFLLQAEGIGSIRFIWDKARALITRHEGPRTEAER